MKRLMIIEDYEPKMSLMETEIAVKQTKDFFENSLSKVLNLTRVSAPLFVLPETGLNDNLNGYERPVSFDIKETGKVAEIVHSLAKWKRMALHRYKVEASKGIYTDMNAIRRDEDMDNLHSIYVDQWDWERVVTKEQRNEEFLKDVIRKIYKVFKDTETFLYEKYPFLGKNLPEEIKFITTQELEDLYPNLKPSEREDRAAKEHYAVFIMKIGGTLKSGEKHDGRAPDYDDWELNGDIVFWNPVLNRAFELSSMGIRVDEESLKSQLVIADAEERKELKYHQMILNKTLPYTIGGGIGQSRICMYFLRKAHIGEVQASIWPEEMITDCESHGINLL
ncbi:aspartate--ammonia ligase [Vallitalea sp.]|jgi:aspartate--ammonia ligase|uniref:aspartate--ammonia ligase n=1 Tax=Vallitalea sp. TaxID=1882829 RepID=UPI0025FF726E|nr:aspartate--ammonia ligase [Vallitalea sp.]MCT4688778.1 aspartate--ammonia ligase [Vallitalea sp.]